MAARRAAGRVVSVLTNPTEDLPYVVELWNLSRIAVERVLGRASSATLAQAIYAAAQTEHVDRRITLRHGDEIIAARN
jgi:hypothetical protein